MLSVCLIAICLVLAQPVLPRQDQKQPETPASQMRPEFTEAEKAWWIEVERTESELVKLQDDNRRELAEVKARVEQSYRERGDRRLEKFLQEVDDKQQAVHRKFTPLIKRAIKSYQELVATGVKQNIRVPLEGERSPIILQREKATYTDEARQNKVQGAVVISVVFQPDGKLGDIHVIQGLPNGLTGKAVEVAKKLVFRPAVKQNRFVATRGNLEFTFNLY
jgi:TonB family protein